MLISYGIKGLKSFGEYTDVNMYSNNKLEEFKESLYKIKGKEALLPMMLLYGPNGSGKTNFINVLSYVKISLYNFELFKNNLIGVRDIIELQVEILIEQKKCVYNFEYSKIQNKVISEEFGINDQEYLCVYSIKDGILKELSENYFDKEAKERIEIYVEDLSQKSLLLEKISNTKIFNNSIMSKFHQFIDKNVVNLSYNDNITPKYNIILSNEKEKTNFINELIKFDSDITDISEEVVNKEDIKSEMPRVLYEKIMNEINNEDNLKQGNKKRIMISSRDIQFIFEKKDDKIKIFKYVYNLKGVEETVNYSDLSDGTKAIIHILDAILVKKNTVFIIDEIERSFHPLLLEMLIRYLRKNSMENENQFIMSTHNINILKINYFRRDEINFIDKINAVSSVYNLNRYFIRKDTNLSKAYKNGRFGGIPHLLDLDL